MIVFESSKDFFEVLVKNLRREGDRRSDEDVLRPFLSSLRRGHERSLAERRLTDYEAAVVLNAGRAASKPRALEVFRGPAIPVPHARAKPLAPTSYERGWLAKASIPENQNRAKRAKLEAVT